MNSGKLIFDYESRNVHHHEHACHNLNNGKFKLNQNPLKIPNKSVIISRDKGDYIEFMHSDVATDSGQTAVPFWDAQSVAPVPAVPLKGFGFHWKCAGNSGGFIAPVFIPHDYEAFKDLEFYDIEMKILKLETKLIDYLKNLITIGVDNILLLN